MRLLLIIVVLMGCQVSKKQHATDSSIKNVVIDGGAWNGGKIPVCWEKSFMPYPRERRIIREAVEREYDARTLHVRFGGWDSCKEDFDGVRVGIDNQEHSRVLALGSPVRGIENGLTINMNQILSLTGDARNHLLEFVAVHEFGHVVGLMHEENHPDYRCPDHPITRLDTPGAIAIHGFDPDSIMSICLFRTNLQNADLEGKARLSSGDLKSIDMYYGKNLATPMSHSCKSAGGRWSTMRKAPGCCFDTSTLKNVKAITFCGSDEYINHPMTGTKEEIEDALTTICGQAGLGYQADSFRCQQK